jgi:hypothetical protein
MHGTTIRRIRAHAIALAALAATAAVGLGSSVGAPPAAAACASVVTYGGVDYAGVVTPVAGEVGRRVGIGSVPGCTDGAVNGVPRTVPPAIVPLRRVRGVLPRFAVALGRPARLMVAPYTGCPGGALACLRARSARFLAGPSLVTSPGAVAGEPITLSVRARGARRHHVSYGDDVLLQGRVAGRWRSLWHLRIPVSGGMVPEPVRVGPPLAILDIGFGPGSAHQVRLPGVAPGVYRLAALGILGPAGPRRLWLTAPLTIRAPTPNPMCLADGTCVHG